MKLTTEQYDLVNEEVFDEINEMLGTGIGGSNDIAMEIIGDVVSDIEETADWSGLRDDEVCVDDVRIAVRRVVSNRLLEPAQYENLELGGFIDRITTKLLVFMEHNRMSPRDRDWDSIRKSFLEYLKQQANKQ